MACDDATAASAALAAATSKPRSAEVDGLAVQGHSLPDLIEADRYQAAKCAAAGGQPGFGVRFAQLKPPGAA